MSARQRFERYMAHLAEGLGHVDPHAGLNTHCTGLMLPLSPKSVEPMAARSIRCTRALVIRGCTTSWPRHSGRMPRCCAG
jgi:SRSO17 transposase